MTGPEVAARGQGRADVPRHRRAPDPRTFARRTGARLPLVLMNSFATRDAVAAGARRAIPSWPSTACPPDFVQSKVPKLDADDLGPVAWPRRPRARVGAARPRRPVPVAAELRPARRAARRRLRVRVRRERRQPRRGHGRRASSRGSRASGSRSLMEVADRTPADRKGGHLARASAGGGLVLREVAQTPGRGPRRVPGHRPPPLLQHEHAVDRPARAGRGARRSATACSGCR